MSQPLSTKRRQAPSYAVGETWRVGDMYRSIVAIDGNEFRGTSSNSVEYVHEVRWINNAGHSKRGFSDQFRKWLMRAERIGAAT